MDDKHPDCSTDITDADCGGSCEHRKLKRLFITGIIVTVMLALGAVLAYTIIIPKTITDYDDTALDFITNTVLYKFYVIFNFVYYPLPFVLSLIGTLNIKKKPLRSYNILIFAAVTTHSCSLHIYLSLWKINHSLTIVLGLLFYIGLICLILSIGKLKKLNSKPRVNTNLPRGI